ncbi:hypothetical protein F7725_004470 [Dissostichus mawsoni]|uniref:Myozenin 2 n=1 Tax=Dissostichus mawsoni TaxID=36200 RepID=A0A7J5XIT3_DISMA|nr:hypothetical protein F7725_004470 [Dissostichus mawsoni]
MTTVRLTPTHSSSPPPQHKPPSPTQAQCRGAPAPTWVHYPLSDFLPVETDAVPDSSLRVLRTGKPSHRAAMSQFSTMTTSERKMQAAAICREVQSMEEDVEMDLGRKVNMPKDIMLEELSLASNRGSRLFKMRQRRSEKYTFESIQNQTNIQINTENGCATDGQNGENNMEVDQSLAVPNDTPDTTMEPNPESIAPVHLYQSPTTPPWQQAIISDPSLAQTMNLQLSEPKPRPELPGFKSFNRVATPFGGFGKAARPVPIHILQVEPLSECPELQGDAGVDRPSFNRSALGWVSTGDPLPLPAVPLDPTLIPESDDL